jgi:hypothetical protein
VILCQRIELLVWAHSPNNPSQTLRSCLGVALASQIDCALTNFCNPKTIVRRAHDASAVRGRRRSCTAAARHSGGTRSIWILSTSGIPTLYEKHSRMSFVSSVRMVDMAFGNHKFVIPTLHKMIVPAPSERAHADDESAAFCSESSVPR